MPNELKPCDCVIGLWLDYEDTELVTERNLLENIDTENRRVKPIYKTNKEDYYDFEKDVNFERFAFCPYCGKKIDWDAIRERVRDESKIENDI